MCVKLLRRRTSQFSLLLLLVPGTLDTIRADDDTGKLEQRVPWVTSRINGSPEPPSPYRAVRVFEGLSFDQPVEMVDFPDQRRVCVVERLGRIHIFKRNADRPETQLMFDGVREVDGLVTTLGLAFHPEFDRSRFCYIHYNFKREAV